MAASYTASIARLKADLLKIERAGSLTDEDIVASLRALQRAEQRLFRPSRKPRPSRGKAVGRRLIDVIDEVLLVPRFAAHPQGAATIREIQARASKRIERAAIIKAVQRRRTNEASPQMSNDALEAIRHVYPQRGHNGYTKTETAGDRQGHGDGGREAFAEQGGGQDQRAAVGVAARCRT